MEVMKMLHMWLEFEFTRVQRVILLVQLVQDL